MRTITKPGGLQKGDGDTDDRERGTPIHEGGQSAAAVDRLVGILAKWYIMEALSATREGSCS
jgi:hypothetical protein